MPLLSMVALVLSAALEYECCVIVKHGERICSPDMADVRFALRASGCVTPQPLRKQQQSLLNTCIRVSSPGPPPPNVGCSRVSFHCRSNKVSGRYIAAHNRHAAQFLDVTIFTGHLMLGYFEMAYRLGCMQIIFAPVDSPAPGRKEFPSNNFWLLTVSSSERKRHCSEGCGKKHLVHRLYGQSGTCCRIPFGETTSLIYSWCWPRVCYGQMIRSRNADIPICQFLVGLS